MNPVQSGVEDLNEVREMCAEDFIGEVGELIFTPFRIFRTNDPTSSQDFTSKVWKKSMSLREFNDRGAGI